MTREANKFYWRVTCPSKDWLLGVYLEDPTNFFDPADYELNKEDILIQKVPVNPDTKIICYYWDAMYSWVGSGEFAAFNTEEDFDGFEDCVGSLHYEVHREDRG